MIYQQWDLNTGQIARSYPSHGAQLTTIAVRPLGAPVPRGYDPYGSGVNMMVSSDVHKNTNGAQTSTSTNPATQRHTKVNGHGQDGEADGDTDNDYDPLFDDEDGDGPSSANPTSAAPSGGFPPLPNGQTATSTPTAQMPFQLPGMSTAPTGSFQQNGSFRPAAKNSTPILDPVTYNDFSPDIFMTAGIDGQITLWDRRASASGRGFGRLDLPEKTPPWCISVSLPSHELPR